MRLFKALRYLHSRNQISVALPASIAQFSDYIMLKRENEFKMKELLKFI